MASFSSEEQEEEDEDDDFGASTTNQAPPNLKPTFYHEDAKNENDSDIKNRGFYVPKLAGFEYLEGPEDVKNAAKLERAK
jgi:hypothetical protein